MQSTKRFPLEMENETIALEVRKRRGARRMHLRFQPLSRTATLTIPPFVRLEEGLSFARSRRGWLARQIAAHGAPIPFRHETRIPVLGEELTILHAPDSRGIAREESALRVGGAEEFLARRVRDWLKAELRRVIVKLAEAKAAELDRSIRKISLRDTVSRWGSCNARGHLSFSWRLVFAPKEVVEYLVAHEVAHLKEMHHGPAFWRLVEKLQPGHAAARAWLVRHGAGLYRYDV